MTELSTLLTVSKYITVVPQLERSSESYNCIVCKDYRFQRYSIYCENLSTVHVHTGIHSGNPTNWVVWWCSLKFFIIY